MKFVTTGIFLLLCLTVMVAQSPGKRSRREMQPPGVSRGGSTFRELQPINNGKIVYDQIQNIYWLADANLAGDPKMRTELGVTGINPNGSMDYPTAQKWVAALNNYNSGKGYLGHNNWQLPVTPAHDKTCSSFNVDNFGATCTGSALGNLYTVGLGKTFPDSVVPDFSATIGPFENLQPSLYWTLDTNPGGEVTFSFLTDIKAANTPKYNYMHVLATIPGAIGGEAPAGSGVVAYTSGKAKGKAVYDATVSGGRSWLLDANLARSDQFGIKGTTTISSKVNGQTLTVPLIDKDGAMLFDTANDPKSGWIAEMNNNNYAGANNWAIPHYNDLQTLFTDLKLQAYDSRLVYEGTVGPFQHLQPFFYWACQRDQKGNSQSPCNPSLNPPPSGTQSMAWSFNFDNGFEGTSQTSKPFYVMVYYPASAAPSPGPGPRPPLKCGTPRQCCLKAGGTWVGNHCE